MAQNHSFNLSDDEIFKIGLISLNWAQVDFVLGVALEHVAGISGPVAHEVLSDIQAEKKIKIIKKLCDHDGLDPYIDDLNWGFSNLKSSRNVLSHGVVLTSEVDKSDRRFTSLKRREFNPDDLEKALRHSKWMINVALGFMMIALGHRPPTKADRPNL